jgi:hypothetical protein
MVSLLASYIERHWDGFLPASKFHRQAPGFGFLASKFHRQALGWFLCQQVTLTGTGMGLSSSKLHRQALGWFLCQQVTLTGTGMVYLLVSYIGRQWDGFSGSKLHRQALG